MDHSSKNQHLALNRMSKNIRKTPLLHHHPNFPANHKPPPPPQAAAPAAAPPQPQVYNISKNDFRSIVQQLTGTPSRDSANPNPNLLPPPARPPHPKPPSMRLQKIRPPPLTPIARPPPPIPRPNPNPVWAESPVSAYMRYLEGSLQLSPVPGGMPYPGPAFPSPRANPHPPPPGATTTDIRSPGWNPNHHPGLLPSPGSQYPLPSPSSFLNLLSPRSPYPLLSPGFQHPPPFSPNFSFSPRTSQSGILGPGPPSPGLVFPQSPSGFLPLLSPRWRDM